MTMDQATRQKIEQRIAALEQQRMKMVMNIAAIDGAVAELKRLLAEPEPVQPEPEVQA